MGTIDMHPDVFPFGESRDSIQIIISTGRRCTCTTNDGDNLTTIIDSLVIKWPAGGLDYYLDVPINSTFSAEEVPFTCNGDFNLDGIIDVQDFILFNSMFGQDCLNCREDMNNDGKVDVLDFLLFNSAFGNTCE